MPWTIWLTTNLLGTNIIGIRFGAWLYGLGALIFIYLISRKFWNHKITFWVIFATISVPLFNTAGIFFTPDPPLIFFWLGTTYFIIQAIERRHWKYWILTGLFGGLAMLSKYTAVFWFISAFLFLLLHSDGRKYFRTPKPYIAVLVALVAFSPEIIWNAQNDWASFAYQSTRRANEMRTLRIDYFLGYLGAQLFAISPVLYLGAIVTMFSSAIKCIREKWKKISFRATETVNLVLFSFSLPMLLFFSAVGLVYWVKLNWLIPIYFIPIAGFVANSIHNRKKWHIWGTSIAMITTITITIVMLFPIVPITGELASTFGWKTLAEYVNSKLDTMPSNTFIFGGEYKVPSELSFHLPNHPQTAGPNVIGRPGLQYTYWVNVDTLIGRDAIFVIDPRWGFGYEHGERLVEKYFREVNKCDELEILRAGTKLTTFHIYECHHYKGTEREQ